MRIRVALYIIYIVVAKPAASTPLLPPNSNGVLEFILVMGQFHKSLVIYENFPRRSQLICDVDLIKSGMKAFASTPFKLLALHINVLKYTHMYPIQNNF